MDSEQTAGTTKACLDQFTKKYDFLAARRVLAAFCQVRSETASAWQRGLRLPVGVALLRLRIFLELAGFQVGEYRELPDANKKLAELLAFDIVTHEQATARLGYQDDHGVLELVLRGRRIMAVNAGKLDDLLKEFSGQLTAAREDAVRRINAVLTGASIGDPPVSQAASSNGHGGDSSEEEVIRLIHEMDRRNSDLEQQLEEERTAHAATRRELEELRTASSHPIITDELRKKYLKD